MVKRQIAVIGRFLKGLSHDALIGMTVRGRFFKGFTHEELFRKTFLSWSPPERGGELD